MTTNLRTKDKKIRKSDMSVETITDILHEYIYEKLNDSPETEEETKIRYLNKRKTRTNKETGDKPANFKKIDCNRCVAPDWSRQLECPARGKKCAKCGKIGHFEKCCRSNKNISYIYIYIYGKLIKVLTDHQALEPLIKRNRSNKTYSARLTRWLDRLAHFTINVNHIGGKHLALTD